LQLVFLDAYLYCTFKFISLVALFKLVSVLKRKPKNHVSLSMQANSAGMLEGDGTPDHVRTAFARNNLETPCSSPSSSLRGASHPQNLMARLPMAEDTMQEESLDTASNGAPSLTFESNCLILLCTLQRDPESSCEALCSTDSIEEIGIR
jgi:hypothetical protein